jgi:hypothetical protein
VADLPKIDLNFPGGTPRELVAAIQKASGRPLNVIISDEDNNSTVLPALRMKAVNVVQLLLALAPASQKQVPVVTGVSVNGAGLRIPSFSYQREGYAFEPQGPPAEDSVWYFNVHRTAVPPSLADAEKEASVCRFYQLGPYLERGYSVDDITFAIRSGWKLLAPMLHVGEPEVNYHKDTHLLIAAGDPAMLKLIDDALHQLEKWPGKGGSGVQPTKPANQTEPAK